MRGLYRVREGGANAHPDVVSIRPAAGSRSIKVELIREEVIRRAHQRPNEGMRQVFIIEDSHLLTRVSQNALLKTLEEPSAGTILILVTPNLHALLPTVISRCRRLRFQGLARVDLLAILEERCGDAGADVEKLVSLSMGRLGVAMSSDAEALSDRRDEAMRFLEELSAQAGRADEVTLITIASERAGSGASEKRDDSLLEMLRGLLRDILITQESPETIELWACGHTGGAGRHGRALGKRGSDQSPRKGGVGHARRGRREYQPVPDARDFGIFPAGDRSRRGLR